MPSGIIRRSLTVAAVGLAAVALAACASSSGAGPDGSTPATHEDLVGAWVTGETYSAPDQPYLAFADDGTWKGSDGCNRTSGDWSVADDGSLTTTAGFSTLIGCQGAPLPKLLGESALAYLDSGTLVLADADGATLLELVPAPADSGLE
jgi:heat shock protein HslJ